LILGKFSIGIGDRFMHQGKAQLLAVQRAAESGVIITPVWNKSFREHEIIGTRPESTRQEADDAVKANCWHEAYFVDADHISLKTVDFFMTSSDFFTLDVADFIGLSCDEVKIEEFVKQHENYIGDLDIPQMDQPLSISRKLVEKSARKFLFAIEEAGKIYRHIVKAKGEDNYIIEVSMDETDTPQTPEELLFILAAIAGEGIPVQTIAPRFTGRFNKGIDYAGDVDEFTKEFIQDLAVINFGIQAFSLPGNLKLSVHSGSDKFSIYNSIREALRKFDSGLHLKTAGTTWLEELIGLAEAGGDGLELVKEIYGQAYLRMSTLCQPYAAVIDIDKKNLPTNEDVKSWDSGMFTSALRHDQANQNYNLHLRQLLHVGYKIAAEKGEEYFSALKQHEEIISNNVTENIFERHIKRLFL